ncbi:ABC transporter ATP-binding protein [Bulleidia sp. zg-1006]|uniref:ABC transporter ATP-binding protein n=1 Tax=Bulleidia sp. zg-1006 TaxID=2806552 RepID=UPI00193A3D0A|nr:ABC transporter ATP-binding protein [Bulleidia sp. zg-1006]QRG86479.1 ABC transporter ATP-binding protein [Bulleidia sp. zg-1006]
MKRLFSYTHGYKKEILLAPLFKMLEALMDLFIPILVADMINHGIQNGLSTYLYSRFFLMIALAIIGFGFSTLAQYFAAKASAGICSQIRQALFNHIQDLSYKELDHVGKSTLITRLTSDINTIQNGLNLALRLMLRSPFVVFGSMIMAFTIHIQAALIFVVAIPILFFVVFAIMFVSIPLFKKVQAQLDEVMKATRENLTGVRVIRAFCKEEAFNQNFQNKNNLLTKLSEKVGRISALLNPVTYLLIHLATVFLIYTGYLQIQSGTMAQGDLVALYNYTTQMIIELIKLASLIMTINRALACSERVADILDIPSTIQYAQKNLASQTHGKVEFKDVSFYYEEGAKPSLNHVSFIAHPKETIGIIGGTGSGKSTLVQLIPRFYDAQQGEILVDNYPVKDYPQEQLIQKIGIVPQKTVLFKGSIRENLLYGNQQAGDEELWQALTIAQAKEVVEQKEDQLNFQLEQGGKNLSGGQKQRLTIARALVRKPEILILDDSASALDLATDASLRKALDSIQNTTIFIVSQRISSLKHCDTILVLDNGQLVGQGKHADLLKECAVYQEIYNSQFPN